MTARDPRRKPAANGNPDSHDLHLAGVVHDVNQMLAVITGRVGLLLEQTAEAATRRHLQAIRLAAADAAQMLRRLEPGSGGPAPGTGPARLRSVAEEAGLLAWPQSAAERPWRNRIDADLWADAPPTVVREVLVNLLLNAREAMGATGGVTLTGGPGPAGRIHLEVADEGPGLPAGDPERIFAYGESGSGEPGRGVGLAGCRHLLATVGGELRALPAAGRGARFRLELPAAPAAVADPAPDGAPDGPVPSLDVLVVDDEAGVREMLQDVLTSLGCRTRACRDGREALAIHRPGDFALAVIDCNLPGLGGVELATRLRVGDPCLAIALISGWRGDEGSSAAGPDVVDFAARKPLALERIREIVREGHRLHEARRAGRADP